jgi:hypothetical protein
MEMKSAKRLYVVTEQLYDGRFRNHLVNAVSRTAALGHVVMANHVVGIATSAEVAKLMGQGLKVEEAADEPDPSDKVALGHSDDKGNKVKAPK